LRELIVIARKSGPAATPRGVEIDPVYSLKGATESLNWLRSVLGQGRTLAAEVPPGRFGLFGTAIAASWLAGELGPLVGFFVDGDEDRAGKSHLGRPVYSPRRVPDDSHVHLVLPFDVAERIWQRLEPQRLPWTAHLPPPFATS
jgi:hypothetical protein